MSGVDRQHLSPIPRPSLLRNHARLALVLLLLSFVACAGQPEPEAEPVPDPVHSPAAGITVSLLPEGFAVARNDGEAFVLEPTSPEKTGEMSIEAGEISDYGIELDQQVWQDRESYADRPGGEYLGGNKLVSQLGDAYYSRGRFDAEQGRQEEVAVFAVHPTENRLLTLRYRYPAGDDSSERLPELLNLLGAIEAAAVPATPAESAD